MGKDFQNVTQTDNINNIDRQFLFFNILYIYVCVALYP